MRLAAIDIGTVTCRLLVAEVEGQTVRELCKRATITNLGLGVDATGSLSEVAMGRVCECVSSYLEIVRGLSADGEDIPVVAMATSASRDARNAEDFAARLARLGLVLSVIPGEREAALSFAGASAPFAGEALLVADVGGGSTELVAGVGGGLPCAAHSFDVGCRRATERFLAGDPPNLGGLQEVRAWARPQFESFFARLDTLGFTPQRMVAVAGTATTVVSVDRDMLEYDATRVHGSEVSFDTLKRVRERLAELPLERRKEVVGLQPERADVIVAGLVILEEIVGASGLGGFTVSESDILEGMIMDAATRAQGSFSGL